MKRSFLKLLGLALFLTSCVTVLNIPELPTGSWLLALSFLTSLAILLDW